MKLASKSDQVTFSRLFHLFQVIYSSGKIRAIFNRFLRQSQKFPRVPIFLQETKLKIDEFLNNDELFTTLLLYSTLRPAKDLVFDSTYLKRKRKSTQINFLKFIAPIYINFNFEQRWTSSKLLKIRTGSIFPYFSSKQQPAAGISRKNHARYRRKPIR